MNLLALAPSSATQKNGCEKRGLTMTEKLVLSVSIKDCEIQTFRSGGKGGQNQNKRDTGVRVIHHPSGARGESREERSQLQNKRTAFIRMVGTKEFQLWLKVALGKEAVIQAAVDRAMDPRNIRTEVKENGRWVEAPAELAKG